MLRENLNLAGDTIGGVFGITPHREDQLRDLLEATCAAYLKEVFTKPPNDLGFAFDKSRLLVLFMAYATTDLEEGYCLYYAAQQVCFIEKTLDKNYPKHLK